MRTKTVRVLKVDGELEALRMLTDRRQELTRQRDRVGVAGVGLAVVAGVEEPDPGGELGRHVHHLLTRLQQSPGQRASSTVAALDGRPGLLPAQARHGQDPPGGVALPQAPHLRRALSPARHRRPPSSRHGPGRALRGDSSIQRGRPAPAHRHFGSATSRTRKPDATTDPAPPKDLRPHSRLTTEGAGMAHTLRQVRMSPTACEGGRARRVYSRGAAVLRRRGSGLRRTRRQ